MGKPIADAVVEVTVNDTVELTRTDADGVYSIVYTPLYNGTVDVKVVYTGNSTVDAVENTTRFTVDKIATVTSVEVINTTLSNVTVRVNVTNATEDLVTKGHVIVYNSSDSSIILGEADLVDGVADITLDIHDAVAVDITVSYVENDLYLASSTDSNVAVSKIPTKASVSILNNTAGNVTIEVTVTNMTDEVVNNGSVNILDKDGNVIANVE